jgi:hypothetical protein
MVVVEVVESADEDAADKNAAEELVTGEEEASELELTSVEVAEMTEEVAANDGMRLLRSTILPPAKHEIAYVLVPMRTLTEKEEHPPSVSS